ncbi:MAG TPA: neocarzinostatin apoprotein domain-containing protein, partial [Acidimicrobiales bacterium]|nr:neocarzinostatin apoprotein domain-containing protein [Acidimicrobiales bacterium]
MALTAGAAVLLPGVLTMDAASAANNPVLVVNPDTGLSGGSVVNVNGSGFTKNSIGNLLECNSDPHQPTVMLGSPINSTLPVSCTAPSYSKLVSTDSQGAISTTYTVVQGTTGPPCGTASAAVQCPATDSAGNSPSADAADYPCPPTAAQESAGDTCTLTYGDQANDSASVAIYFVGENPPPPPTFYITTTSVPAAILGTAYSKQLQAIGGTTSYRWKKVAGQLPKGLKVYHQGLLSGTPNANDTPGTFTFRVQVTTHKSKGNPSMTTTQALTLILTPRAPTGVTATCTSNLGTTVNVSWNAVDQATSYSVDESTTSATAGYT